MENKTLQNKVFEALGEASMCWSETPTGVFNSLKATKIGEKLMEDIYNEVKKTALAFAEDRRIEREILLKIKSYKETEILFHISFDEWYNKFYKNGK